MTEKRIKYVQKRKMGMILSYFMSYFLSNSDNVFISKKRYLNGKSESPFVRMT